MNKFHTPSFGDDVFDLSDTPDQHSKRMRSLDHSVEEYHSANDESYASPTATTTLTNNTLAGSKQTQQQLSNAASTTTTTANESTTLNEPTKPLSSYALFFRDTVSAIKQENPECSFPEITRIVSSMWEALDETHKNVYNKKFELAKQEYLKEIRNFRLQQQRLVDVEQQPQQHINDFSTSTAYNNNDFTNSTQLVINEQPQQTQLQQQQQQVPTNIDATQTPSLAPTPTAPYINTTVVPPPPHQMQLLTEAAATQKCTRENCNKPAIINPDWEDEYCSNECVVIHCRNVFDMWVKTYREETNQ